MRVCMADWSEIATGDMSKSIFTEGKSDVSQASGGSWKHRLKLKAQILRTRMVGVSG